LPSASADGYKILKKNYTQPIAHTKLATISKNKNQPIRKEPIMLKATVAQSLELDSLDAVTEVLRHCSEQLGDMKPQAGILFTGIDHDLKIVLDAINEMYPGINLIGCTMDGELSSVNGYTDYSVSLMLIFSDKVTFKSGAADGISSETADTVKKAVDSVKQELGQEPVLCITTPSGLTASGDFIVEGFRLSLGESFPVFGVTAADQWRKKTTYQFCNDKIYTDAAPFLLFAGPLTYSFGVETGWIPIGKMAEVTSSDNNVLHKIGNDSDLAFYKHHLGESIGLGDEPIADYPLAVFEEDKENFYLRSTIVINRETGSMTFVGNIPQGSTVQITHSTRDKIVEAAKVSVKGSLTDHPVKNPSAALCFSCASRKQLLVTRVEEEYDAFKKDFPDVPVIGFYTYGEIGPLGRDKPARFYNNTFFNLTLGLD
jgi:hypothetical protein